MDFGRYIADLRDKKRLSLRELEKRASDLSHVYIWRLEKGDRDAPSAATVEKLAKALELSAREHEIVSLLLKTEIDDQLFALIVERPDIAIEDVEPVATMSFRGNRPTDQPGWERLIEMVKSF
ncbi:transcriptional regulator with XRE-family HTH domain [Tahibacter aquaticus]|uniref:Transcriptional regulator with XRE-family HTH domain n=1 Tax=Tahibacter aquaticus TaxID=520092 RepID=A0A4R6Z283_9GAMM|nr:helix-turn-helix transcriptional regulator [Tahibacter aquaticus]TDR45687.1 transcriptional regulator with XRE-family HTH domain [Tahibacter aquaticus]